MRKRFATIAIFAVTSALGHYFVLSHYAFAQTVSGGGPSHGVMAPVTGAQVGNHNGRSAPLFSDLGSYEHKISTRNAMAQRYFNQGLTLAYAFNHAEAIRSFKEATRLDPDCAMAYWGIALASGPNINAPMDETANPEAFAALQKAVALMANVSEKERAFIEALQKRYTEKAPKDRKPLDRAFAVAMREVAVRFPDDPDALTLSAEAVMDTTPWDYWTKDGKPNEGIAGAITAVERALDLSPNHPGANHMYIHLMEASPNPEKALPSAHRLRWIAPGAGHLVHMPAHIYIRTGRYREASLANEQAVEADNSYNSQCRAQGMYPLIYMPHNHHFLWATATLEGRGDVALKAARQIAEHIDTKQMRQPGYGTLQHFWITPLYVLVRFGRWDEILLISPPDKELVYPRGVWYYARAMAFLRKGMVESANRELAELAKIAEDPILKTVTVSDINTTAQLLQIAVEVVRGELAASEKDWVKAIRYLSHAVQLEDALNYDEPPPWHQSTRLNLGAVLIEAGRYEEAKKVYQADLRRYPENGWALYGLLQCAWRRGDSEEARRLQRRFNEAWREADTVLPASRF